MQRLTLLAGTLAVLGALNTAISSDVKPDFDEIQTIVRGNFGVSVGALAHLLTMHSEGYVPKQMLEKDGALKFLEELQGAGLVTISTTKGLPDGTMGNDEFVRVIVSEEGKSVIDGFAK